MVEKVRVEIATGEVSKERWYVLTSQPPGQGSPEELLRLFRSHWSIENSHHHVKDRSWDEDRPHLAPSGAGRGIRYLGEHRAERPAAGRMVPIPDVHAPADQRLRILPDTDHRSPIWSTFLTLQSS